MRSVVLTALTILACVAITFGGCRRQQPVTPKKAPAGTAETAPPPTTAAPEKTGAKTPTKSATTTPAKTETSAAPAPSQKPAAK